jgi:hypothetical protein
MATGAERIDHSGVEIGRVAARAFATIGGNPAATLGIAFLFSAAPGTAVNFIVQRFRAEAASIDGVFEGLALSGAAMFAGMIFQLIAQGALMRATVAAASDDRVSFTDCAATGLFAAIPLLALGILSGLAISLGLVLFVVPGMFLWVIWSVSGPALVAERVGPIGAMGRSAELTRGARWKVLGLQLLVLIFYWIVSATLSALLVTVYGGMTRLAEAMGSGVPIFWAIGNALVATFTTAVGALVQSSLYIELREWKEGPAVDRLAEVFG